MFVMASPIVQIFGQKKCAETRKAERWFKERRVAVSMQDLAVRGPSPGELKNIADAVGGYEALIDREGSRYRDLGPRIAHFVLPIAGKGDSDWAYSWVPVVGPIIGAVIAAVLLTSLGI